MGTSSSSTSSSVEKTVAATSAVDISSNTKKKKSTRNLKKKKHTLPSASSSPQKQQQLLLKDQRMRAALLCSLRQAKLQDDLWYFMFPMNGILLSFFLYGGIKFSPRYFIPVIPICFSTAYVVDAAYNFKGKRISRAARRLLENNKCNLGASGEEGGGNGDDIDFTSKLIEETVSSSLQAATSLGSVSSLAGFS